MTSFDIIGACLVAALPVFAAAFAIRAIRKPLWALLPKF